MSDGGAALPERRRERSESGSGSGEGERRAAALTLAPARAPRSPPPAHSLFFCARSLALLDALVGRREARRLDLAPLRERHAELVVARLGLRRGEEDGALERLVALEDDRRLAADRAAARLAVILDLRRELRLAVDLLRVPLGPVAAALRVAVLDDRLADGLVAADLLAVLVAVAVLARELLALADERTELLRARDGRGRRRRERRRLRGGRRGKGGGG
jgi:hypothetical protein